MILLIDDDQSFRGALADLLREDGYVVSEYGAASAVPHVARLEGVRLLITDYEMPGEDGITFADRFHAAHPTVPVLVLTGYWKEHLAAQVTNRDFVYFLCKPLNYDLIQGVVNDLTSYPRKVEVG